MRIPSRHIARSMRRNADLGFREILPIAARSFIQEGIRESLRALVNRGLITMRPTDDPNDEWRKRFPDRLKAMYSIKGE